VSEQEAIRDARRSLGRQLAAWRLKAGLTQGQLARRTGYHRTTIAHAEAGDRASRDLADAVDRVLGAGGRLTAARDAISAAATARSQTAPRPRGRAAATTASDLPPVPAEVVSTVESTCPLCDQRVAVRVAVSLLPAVPPVPQP
jgi:transcriptional regulator with XRE-family HTH domain